MRAEQKSGRPSAARSLRKVLLNILRAVLLPSARPDIAPPGSDDSLVSVVPVAAPSEPFKAKEGQLALWELPAAGANRGRPAGASQTAASEQDGR